jgi:spore coat polysaccharide biosynthesis predicted glycosyltransferase SpsG
MKTVWLSSSSVQDQGLGHLSRCIALAEELRARDHNACFKHFSVPTTEGEKLLSESGFVYDCTCDKNPNLHIIDSYIPDFISICTKSELAPSVLIVDDTSPRVYADYYVQASPIHAWMPLNVNAGIFKFEMNPILRCAFDNPIRRTRPRHFPIRVLISLGAARNELDIVKTVIPLIKDRSAFDSTISIITRREENARILEDMFDSGLDFVKETSFRLLLKNYDFVISAGGVTSWELIALKVPGILIGVAENQVEQIKYLRKHDLRSGIIYDNSKKFENEFGHLLDTHSSKSMLSFPQLHKLRSGRIEVAKWLIEIMR